MTKIIHPGNLQCFLDCYKSNLISSVQQKPTEYAWAISEIDKVFERMSTAIQKGAFNKDSPAFRKTCKELGINHTYKAIQEFISL